MRCPLFLLFAILVQNAFCVAFNGFRKNPWREETFRKKIASKHHAAYGIAGNLKFMKKINPNAELECATLCLNALNCIAFQILDDINCYKITRIKKLTLLDQEGTKTFTSWIGQSFLDFQSTIFIFRPKTLKSYFFRLHSRIGDGKC